MAIVCRILFTIFRPILSTFGVTLLACNSNNEMIQKIREHGENYEVPKTSASVQALLQKN
jgi:hypothetical protein